MKVAISIPFGLELNALIISGETIKDVLDRLPYDDITSIRMTPNACTSTEIQEYFSDKPIAFEFTGRDVDITIAHSEGKLDDITKSSYLSRIEIVVADCDRLLIFDDSGDPAIRTIVGQAHRSGVLFKKIVMSDLRSKYTTSDLLRWFDRELPF